MNTHNLTDQQKDQLLDFFAYYLPLEMRCRLMAELPRAYNACCGREAVAPELNACKEQQGQRLYHASSASRFPH